MGLLVSYSTLAIPTAMSEECGKVRRGAWAGLAETEEKGWVSRVSRAPGPRPRPAAPTFDSKRVSPVGGRTEELSLPCLYYVPYVLSVPPLCAVLCPKSGSGKFMIQLRNTQGRIVDDP